LRRPSRLIAVAAVAGTLAAGGAVAVAAGLDGGRDYPPRTTLAGAVSRWLGAERPAGVTAEVRLTTRLVDTGRLADGAALLAGATGTVHVASNGHARLDVRTVRGDAVVTFDGERLAIYDARTNTVYRLDAPVALRQAVAQAAEGGAPSSAAIAVALAGLATQASVRGPEPGNTAGQPSYTVRLSPRRDAGLLGALEVAWDAVRGVPLRVALYAEGGDEPVVELEATEVSYAPVAEADVTIEPPGDARVVDLASRLDDLRAEAEQHLDAEGAEGVEAVSRAVPFGLRAPEALVGLPLSGIRAVTWDGRPAAVALYGRGLGQVVVLQEPAGAGDLAAEGRAGALPRVAIEGAVGWELVTALGTVLRVEREGVRYTVAGSVPAVAAEAAVRELLR
jgi:hypothetical protein